MEAVGTHDDHKSEAEESEEASHSTDKEQEKLQVPASPIKQVTASKSFAHISELSHHAEKRKLESPRAIDNQWEEVILSEERLKIRGSTLSYHFS